MATVVCRGLQSGLESQLMSESRTALKFKLSTSTKSHLSQPFELILKPTSFLDSSNRDKPKELPYAPPFPNPTPSLSDKSLKMCTENLGNETGTDMIIENTVFVASANLKVDDLDKRERVKSPTQIPGMKRLLNEFPPPLTTIRGLESLLRVRTQRKDGRLIMEAIDVPVRPSNFRAERRDGRLRLCFSEYSMNNHFDSEEVEESKESTEGHDKHTNNGN